MAFNYSCIAEGWIGMLPEIDELTATLQRDLSQPIFSFAWRKGEQLDFQRKVEAMKMIV